ncbi:MULTISPECIES: AI-2E family transporter [Halorussus]|uniref:AI-2E family transporter n=1 Tax=Halorussus TaxID=1070314 RepID=UPI0020A07F4D|nr:AI-2E family transporter [Halorussus vallis]USZ74393.1 AI-2E family transporter [Halorussus vallis]
MSVLPEDRERLAWWAFTFAVVGVFAFVLWAFVGTVVLGIFIYYGMRPVYRRLRGVFSSDVAADVTVLLVSLPVFALVGYTAFVGLQELSQFTGAPLSSFARFVPGTPEQATALAEDLQKALGPQPTQTPREKMLSTAVSIGSAVATGLAHFVLSMLLAFVLLREDHRIAAWFRDQFGAKGSAAHAYAMAVDDDLREVYVGNVLTVFVVTGLGVVVYNGLNVLAPVASDGVPVPTLLALLTGVATLIPLVVGKVVYVPVGAYMAYQAVNGGGPVWFPLVFFAVCFLLLDLLPVAVLRPYIAGRNVHGGLMVFAYVGGTMLFGWYGLFLGPLLVVVAVHLARIVVPELVHGEPVTRRIQAAESIGSTPDEAADASDLAPDDAPEDVTSDESPAGNASRRDGGTDS